MNIFDIVGPIMVGPSSSHTAGVVRIGNIVKNILGETPTYIKMSFHGSFAKTYAGHGSDRAIIAGLLGFQPDDEKIKYSLDIAKEKSIDFSFATVELSGVHPNTLVAEVKTNESELLRVQGESIGGGNIIIKKINDTVVDFTGQYDTIIISHFDHKGVISLVTNLLSIEHINIASMKVYRANKGGEAIMIIETDEKLNKDLEKMLIVLPYIKNVTVLSH